MTIQENPLSAPRMRLDEDNPFAGDLFKRRELSVQLTDYINRLRDGTVLAIDAPWGDGKSWFGRNWSTTLNSQGYRVIYLDAFQQDYIEDPFLLIASEIKEVISAGDPVGKDLMEKAANVMKAILPLSTKVLINIAGRLALGTVDASKDIEDAVLAASDSTAEATQQWLENKIDDYAKEKESLESFRNALKEFCASQEKPVIFFIDELDRCRPDFSVKLIERLKHFFDVPNLVFVLLLNQNQLEKAIKGLYGAETDAAAYLRKFIHMNLRLPKNVDTSSEQMNANWKYLNQLSDHYNFKNTQELRHFINSLSVFASITGMSLRDLEKGMALLALNGVNNSATYLAWPVVLKLKFPEIFNGLLKEDINAHKDAAELLQGMHASEHYQFWAKKYFLPYHVLKGYGQDKLSEEQKADLEQYKPTSYYHTDNPLLFWLKRLDISSQE